MSVYLDNAATSYPKPDPVYAAVEHAMKEVGASPGRGAYRRAREASDIVSNTRAKIARFFSVPNSDRIVFTKSATEGINLVLKGWLRPGDRVLISAMEHNAVVRPLERLKGEGVKVEVIPCRHRGLLDLDALRERLGVPVRLVVVNHASNVNGLLQPVEAVAELCSAHGVPLFLDAAQTAGIQPISVSGLDLGMFSCSGHKGLLGPHGTGILYIRSDLDVLPLMEGGTGSLSEEATQPEFCPDRYESGTPNLPGIAGLGAGIDFILQAGLDAILAHELELCSHLEKELRSIPSLLLYTPEIRGTGTLSFTVEGMNSGEIGYILDEVFGIAVRTGLHCAPMAHRTLGTLPEGTVRVSVGYSTTMAEIEYFVESLRTLVAQRS